MRSFWNLLGMKQEHFYSWFWQHFLSYYFMIFKWCYKKVTNLFFSRTLIFWICILVHFNFRPWWLCLMTTLTHLQISQQLDSFRVQCLALTSSSTTDIKEFTSAWRNLLQCQQEIPISLSCCCCRDDMEVNITLLPYHWIFNYYRK